MKRFALIGAAGYVAPRHMCAIRDTGNRLVAAMDPSDSVGVIDSYFPEAHFFTEFERFDRHLDKLRRGGGQVDFLSVCSPNYLHDAHCRFGLRSGMNVICEKPLVLNPWNIDALQEIEEETGHRIFNILQLRLHPAIIALREKIQAQSAGERHQVDLTYITSRGKWYQVSWKGDQTKSGGIVTNIGIHFFDMLTWIFGEVEEIDVEYHAPDRAMGYMRLSKADVNWFLSLDMQDLPVQVAQEGLRTFRNVSVDGEAIEFSEGFKDLHTMSYVDILNGGGFGTEQVRASIDIVSRIRHQ